jgi:ATP-dependent Lhr-like helicase
VILTWLGDSANNTLKLLLKHREITAYTGALGLTVPGRSRAEVAEALAEIGDSPRPPLEHLLGGAENLRVEKWDWALPRSLLVRNYASLYLAFGETEAWLESVSNEE